MTLKDIKRVMALGLPVMYNEMTYTLTGVIIKPKSVMCNADSDFVYTGELRDKCANSSYFYVPLAEIEEKETTNEKS